MSAFERFWILMCAYWSASPLSHFVGVEVFLPFTMACNRLVLIFNQFKILQHHAQVLRGDVTIYHILESHVEALKCLDGSK
ncbi:hypothetical protein GOP47_0010602 [Adiantum capillus-veneris]|uniref:Uncharacterized protein n=1 Tax=Adiantum capillus-veneris TaxID=13818 RepID=A0A9D4UVF4_ADICA|nr:hypothetical protein GOP47_0010602 [Adiantum capillus-veneris]